MFDLRLKDIKDQAFTAIPESILYAFTPNQLSFFGLLVGLVSIAFISIEQYYVALVFWLLNRLIDGLDGYVARVTEQSSGVGGYLDMLYDLVMYGGIVAAFIYVNLDNAAVIMSGVLLLVTFYINIGQLFLSSAIAQKRGIEQKRQAVPLPISIIEGAETVILYSSFYLWPQYLRYTFTAFYILMLLTIAHRAWWSLKNL